MKLKTIKKVEKSDFFYEKLSYQLEFSIIK